MSSERLEAQVAPGDPPLDIGRVKSIRECESQIVNPL